MPFTPFHMGPGLAVKAVCGRHFSLMVFGFSQVAMDIEPLVRIVRGDLVLHGFTYTYAGATLLAVLSAAAGRPVCQVLLKAWKPDPSFPFQHWLRGPPVIAWPAATVAAAVGTYSHVFLDSIMHPDMKPLAPISSGNALLHVIPVEALHLGCVLAGALGATIVSARYLFRPRDRAATSV